MVVVKEIKPRGSERQADYVIYSVVSEKHQESVRDSLQNPIVNNYLHAVFFLKPKDILSLKNLQSVIICQDLPDQFYLTVIYCNE